MDPIDRRIDRRDLLLTLLRNQRLWHHTHLNRQMLVHLSFDSLPFLVLLQKLLKICVYNKIPSVISEVLLAL